MAGDEGFPTRDPVEERLLRRVRIICVIVILTMIVFLLTVDTFGRLFIDPNFHTNEVFVGTLVGALFPLVGVVSVSRLPSLPKGK